MFETPREKHYALLELASPLFLLCYKHLAALRPGHKTGVPFPNRRRTTSL